MADDGDLLRTAVTELVARQQTGQALVVSDTGQEFPDAGPVYDQGAVVVKVTGSLNGIQ